MKNSIYSEFDALLRKANKRYAELKDSNGNQLRIGDFVRINMRLKGDYKCQMLYKVCFGLFDGIYFSALGLYKDEHLEDYGTEKPYVVETNQWGLHTNIEHPRYYYDEAGIIWSAEDYTRMQVKVVNIEEEFDKVMWCYTSVSYMLWNMGEKDKHSNLSACGDAELFYDYLSENKASAITALKNL